MDLRYGPEERNRIDYSPRAATARCSPSSTAATGRCAQGDLLLHRRGAARLGHQRRAYRLHSRRRNASTASSPNPCRDKLAARQHSTLGGDPRKLFASGWSAGGHLTAMTMSHAAVRGGLAISGIYDLEPMRLCYINDKLRLDKTRRGGTVRALRKSRCSSPMARRAAGAMPAIRGLRESSKTESDGARRNHFTILEELASPHGAHCARAQAERKKARDPFLGKESRFLLEQGDHQKEDCHATTTSGNTSCPSVNSPARYLSRSEAGFGTKKSLRSGGKRRLSGR